LAKKNRKHIRKLGIGRKSNTSHMERLNGTIRGQPRRAGGQATCRLEQKRPKSVFWAENGHWYGYIVMLQSYKATVSPYIKALLPYIEALRLYIVAL
jgi:hypothetical protein